LQGKDCGEIKLRLTYVPLERSNPMVPNDFGALFVYAKKGKDFPRMNPKVANSCNPYFSARVGDDKKQSIKRQNTTVRAPADAAPVHFTIGLHLAADGLCAMCRVRACLAGTCQSRT
jgi:hypothetical protein